MEKNNEIEISILKGDKLFNQNTPFVINLSCAELDEENKKCNADLICVIDVSDSMVGEKINYVRESLKILLDLMDENDRICLILFSTFAENYFNLNYLTKQNKKILINKIDQIVADGWTNILDGLKLALDIIKKECVNQIRSSTILLLSDGKDNLYDDVEIANSLKNMTKGLGLSFTLNTFGYGGDHDPKIMNKLANIRDGAFFYVDDYSKISQYFVAVLGGCLSTISKKVDLNLQILNNNCMISRILGEDNLYNYTSNSYYFKTSMLQFICGKDYTFVLEIFVNENKVKVGEEIFKVEIKYEDITHNNKKIKKNYIYNFHKKDPENSKANEEYIRAQIYSTIDKAIKLKDQGQMKKGKELIENIEKWLINNYKGPNKDYIKDVRNSKGLFSENDKTIMRSYIISNTTINEKLYKNLGKTMSSLNRMQTNMVKSISNTIPQKKEFDFNQFPQSQIIYKKIVPIASNKIDNEYKQINFNNNKFEDKRKKVIQPNYEINIDNTYNNKRIYFFQSKNYEKRNITDNISIRRNNSEFIRINTEPINNINQTTYIKGHNAFYQLPKKSINNINQTNYIKRYNALNQSEAKPIYYIKNYNELNQSEKKPIYNINQTTYIKSNNILNQSEKKPNGNINLTTFIRGYNALNQSGKGPINNHIQTTYIKSYNALNQSKKKPINKIKQINYIKSYNALNQSGQNPSNPSNPNKINNYNQTGIINNYYRDNNQNGKIYNSYGEKDKYNFNNNQ